LLKISQETHWQILKRDYWCYEIWKFSTCCDYFWIFFY